MEGYIYLLQEREFIKTNESIYKIGKSKQEFNKRINGYPKQSHVYLQIYTNNVDAYEKILLDIFSLNFTKRTDIGNEYFDGDVKHMLKIILNYYDSKNLNEIFTLNNNIINKTDEYLTSKKEQLNLKIQKINNNLHKVDKVYKKENKKELKQDIIIEKKEENIYNQKKIKNKLKNI
jgi:hypothetical protein